MSELKAIWHTANDLPKEGDFIAFLTPSGNLLTGNFEGKTDRGFFIIKNRAFEYATIDVVSKWAHVEDLKTTDALRTRIGKLEEALKVIANDDYTRPKMAELAQEALKGEEK